MIERVDIGPLGLEVAIPNDTLGERLRSHFVAFRTENSSKLADGATFLGIPNPAESLAEYREARGELTLSVHAADRPSISGRLRLGPRGLLRGAKNLTNRPRWREGRRSLLIRYAFDHFAMALLHSKYGCLTLHSSAVELDGRAVLLLGANGSGKTSVATSLINHHGYRLLSDNFSPTNGRMVVPFPGPQRFKPDAKNTRTDADYTRSVVPATVRAVVLLRSGTNLSPLVSADARAALLRYFDTEREDHRDTNLFTLLTSASHIDPPTETESDITGRLADVPAYQFDWRTSTTAALAAVLEK